MKMELYKNRLAFSLYIVFYELYAFYCLVALDSTGRVWLNFLTLD